MNKYIKIGVLSILILTFLFCVIYSNWRTRDFLEIKVYDILNENPIVESEVELENILSQFELVALAELPKEYKVEAGMTKAQYSKIVTGMKFYKIDKAASFRKIIGDFRIKDFVAKDKYYTAASCWNRKEIYWGINPKILIKLIKLKQIFKRENLNWDAIKITSGHRTPTRNEQVGGASKSRHILGEAIDLWIGDIDKDGKYTEADKDRILSICEKELIRDEGGIGKYPGTKVIHIDVRGYRARWDSY